MPMLERHLHSGAVLNFSSGYNITYGFIKPAADLDVIMVAPRMIGKGVRETYENGTGFPTFLVVNQDATGHAKEIAVGLAKALGSTKAGAIEVTFNDETYLDLMSEQAIWPLIMNVMVTAFDFFAEKGLPAEAILTEMYMSKEPMVMMEKMADMGLFKQLPLHSRTSQYGQMSRFKMVDNTSMRQFIEEQGYAFFCISAATRQGVEPLVHAIFHKLEQLPPIKRFEVNYVPVMPEKDEDKWKFEINVDEDGVYVVEADWLVKVLGMVNLEDEESLGYFQRVLRQSGIIDRLEEMGINEGDTVSILNFEFDYIR